MQAKNTGGASTRVGKAAVAVFRALEGVRDRAAGMAGRATRVVDRVGKSDTDALTLLEAQHRQVDKQFLATAKESGLMKKLAAFEEVAQLLELHATIEEQHFYPAVDTSETKELVKESRREHAEMRRLIAAVRGADDEAAFDEKLAELKKAVRHHAKDEEEGKLFPRVARLMDGDQREAIGQEMLATMVELLEKQQTRH